MTRIRLSEAEWYSTQIAKMAEQIATRQGTGGSAPVLARRIADYARYLVEAADPRVAADTPEESG